MMPFITFKSHQKQTRRNKFWPSVWIQFIPKSLGWGLRRDEVSSLNIWSLQTQLALKGRNHSPELVLSAYCSQAMIGDPGVRQPGLCLPGAHTEARGLSSITSAWEYLEKKQTRKKPGKAGHLKMRLFLGACGKGEGMAMWNRKHVQTLRGSCWAVFVCAAVLHLYLQRPYFIASWTEVGGRHSRAPRCPLSCLPWRETHKQLESCPYLTDEGSQGGKNMFQRRFRLSIFKECQMDIKYFFH